MFSISMSDVLLTAIIIFTTLSLIALGGSLVLRSVLSRYAQHDTTQQANVQLSHSMKKTFVSALVIALLLIYFYLLTTQ